MPVSARQLTAHYRRYRYPISWVDYPSTASPVTSCTDDNTAIYRYTYIMAVKYYLTPPPQFFLPGSTALTTNSSGTQSAHKGKGWGAV
jgi:hypothetical protein